MNVKTFLEKTTSDLRSRTNSFKFYVPTVLEAQPLALEEKSYAAPAPNLLNGEIVIKEAHKVLLFINALDRKRPIQGNLFVTNFRIFLVPNSPIEQISKQVNLLIGEHGICLTNVESLHQISGNKSRKLYSNSNLTGKVKCLRIMCKNFRVMTFSFELSPYDHGKQVAKTILHHAFPGRHSLLFAYEFSEPVTGSDDGIPRFTSHSDWSAELKRTCRDYKDRWRVSPMNNNFAVSMYLPEWLVVPKTLVDIDLMEMARAFCSGRPPTWSWSHSNGAALVRMADCLPAITVRTQENRFMENLRALHPSKKAPIMMELDKSLPSMREINASYLKLREICMPESRNNLELHERKYHSLLENSKWLNYVSNCLKESLSVANHLLSGVSVVLQEGDGRDTSAVIASLVQILLDPRSRTIDGFQSLIQKEWVAMGHPFCSRFGHVAESVFEQSPVFLLFLDCVWQLQRQFDTSFEFNETYLTTLFDSCFVSVFDTFLFDCERLRHYAKAEEKCCLRSVWNWRKQFDASDIVLFRNPLYELDDLIRPQSPRHSSGCLRPQFQIYNLEVWSQCYYRWQPAFGIRRGGRARVDLIHAHLRGGIDACLAELAEISKKTPIELALDRRLSLDRTLAPQSILITNRALDFDVDSHFPFSSCDDETTSSLAECSMQSDFDSQSVLNLTE